MHPRIGILTTACIGLAVAQTLVACGESDDSSSSAKPKDGGSTGGKAGTGASGGSGGSGAQGGTGATGATGGSGGVGGTGNTGGTLIDGAAGSSGGIGGVAGGGGVGSAGTAGGGTGGTSCVSATTDCDADGWLVSEGDCCDQAGACGSEPKLVNPGAREIMGNGVDENCNQLIDFADTADTGACDSGLSSNSSVGGDYAKAIGICRTTSENPALKKDRTWGLISAEILRADGSALADSRAVSIRSNFGNSINALNGSAFAVLSTGIASDGVQSNPGPNGGAPSGNNVSTTHSPSSSVDIASCANPACIKDWYATANLPLKAANGVSVAPACGTATSGDAVALDSVMLRLRLRAPTNARSFSFNTRFFSADYPENLCARDQLIALVDTVGSTSPANPIDKNLFVLSSATYPFGVGLAKDTGHFRICEPTQLSGACVGASGNVAAGSCADGPSALLGTGFEQPTSGTCAIGGGTGWLTTAGNVVPGGIVEIRIAIWDVTDSLFDALALVDGFRWIDQASLPGT